jgi:3-oxoacyl-[acyl-carrier-protein] synthase-3
VTTLAGISTWIPEQTIRIADLREHLGLTSAQVKVLTRVHGLDQVRTESGGSVLDGLLRAARPLIASLPDPAVVKYVLHAHTVLDVAPSTVGVAHAVRDELLLSAATAFSVTQQNCASGLLAVDIAGRLLDADGDQEARALVLLGERPFTPLAQLIPNTTVMGEAAAACLIQPRGERDVLVSFASRTLGRYSAGLDLGAATLHEFDQEYSVTLAGVIGKALEAARVELGDVKLLLPHNVNRSSWLRLARFLPISPDVLFLDNIPRLGHCFCADPFLNYAAAVAQGRLRAGDYYLMVAVGLGATFTAAVLRH